MSSRGVLASLAAFALLNQGLITQGQYEVQSQKLLNELVQ
jgi:hypothetical protein